uniref:Ig-like domain-containing protein n=1 Tax=Xiphophorus maculatus TaxID=8083 RepID=A0A3B5PR70_XIPMA
MVCSLFSSGKEIIQQIIRCDWDEETDNTFGHVKYGNNGEDFITLDTKTETWFATNSKAEVIIDEWNADKTKYEIAKYILQNGCLPLLKVFKSPSSPVTCHATGFFPDKGIMFWRKDGEEIHEGVEHGDLLPNDDGSFQMSVYLEALKIPPEDWGRYECVFQLSDDVVKKPIGMIVGITAAGVFVIIVAAVGFTVIKNRKGKETSQK